MMVWQLFSQSITRLQNKNHHLLAFNPRMTEEVKPESSISFNPLMVIPPGVVTLSISVSGLLLFSNKRSTAPFTVWTTISCAPHTHVPTADQRVFPKGTGYLTDLGMTGAVESVLGIQPQQSVEMFLGGLPGRFRPASGPCKAQGALFTLDSATGLCTAVERVDMR